jgi:hypothetical protein
MSGPVSNGSPDQGSTPNVSEEVARASYLAIRQPAVVRLLEGALATGDGDALAAGLELACQVLEQIEVADGAPADRLESAALEAGMVAIQAGACDATLKAWVARQLEALPLVLTASEERRVTTVIAAVLWALARGAGGDEIVT